MAIDRTDPDYDRLAKAFRRYCVDTSKSQWDQVAELCRMWSLRSDEEEE